MTMENPILRILTNPVIRAWWPPVTLKLPITESFELLHWFASSSIFPSVRFGQTVKIHIHKSIVLNYLDLSPKIPKLLFHLAWLRTHRKMPSVRCILETGAGHVMRHEPRLTSTRVAETIGAKERPLVELKQVPHSQETSMVLSLTLWIFMSFMLPGWWNKI